MRTLIVLVVLLLLLPIGFGTSVQADETDPPIDPGTEDEGGDVEGDHPWGGEERVIIINIEPDKESELRATFSFDDYLKLYLYMYYGLDFLDQSTSEYSRPVTATRYDPRDASLYRADSEKRSSR